MSEKPQIICKECGKPMQYIWSQGTWGTGAWVISCPYAGKFSMPGSGCFMYGATFKPATYEQDFARYRALRVIHRAQQGIIYNNPEGTLDQWIDEAVKRGIVPENWAEWGKVSE